MKHNATIDQELQKVLKDLSKAALKLFASLQPSDEPPILAMSIPDSDSTN
jgi:hypothetical protein